MPTKIYIISLSIHISFKLIISFICVYTFQYNSIPIVVFNIDEPGNILRAALGEDIGTLVGGKK